jgi:hypothetical protein
MAEHNLPNNSRVLKACLASFVRTPKIDSIEEGFVADKTYVP